MVVGGLSRGVDEGSPNLLGACVTYGVSAFAEHFRLLDDTLASSTVHHGGGEMLAHGEHYTKLAQACQIEEARRSTGPLRQTPKLGEGFEPS